MRPIVNMPEEDWATDISNTHKNLVKISHVVPEISSWTDRQTHRHTHQYFATAHAGGKINTARCQNNSAVCTTESAVNTPSRHTGLFSVAWNQYTPSVAFKFNSPADLWRPLVTMFTIAVYCVTMTINISKNTCHILILSRHDHCLIWRWQNRLNWVTTIYLNTHTHTYTNMLNNDFTATFHTILSKLPGHWSSGVIKAKFSRGEILFLTSTSSCISSSINVYSYTTSTNHMWCILLPFYSQYCKTIYVSRHPQLRTRSEVSTV